MPRNDSSGSPVTPNDDALAFSILAARVAAEHRTDGVVVLDLRGLSSIADYFVIGTGTSDRQMHAALAGIEEAARAAGRRPYRVSDPRDSSWLLADYIDVVIHLFDTRRRAYYDLDGLWGDAPRVEWRESTAAVEARAAAR
jgi:ribosome-associated protein